VPVVVPLIVQLKVRLAVELQLSLMVGGKRVMVAQVLPGSGIWTTGRGQLIEGGVLSVMLTVWEQVELHRFPSGTTRLSVNETLQAAEAVTVIVRVPAPAVMLPFPLSVQV